MNIKYKYGDIEVSYEDPKGFTRIDQDKEIMNFVEQKFLNIYNLKKQEEQKSRDTVAELCKMHMERYHE